MRSSLVWVLVSLSLAAGADAPDASVIVPTMEPRNVWLVIAAGNSATIIQTRAATREFRYARLETRLIGQQSLSSRIEARKRRVKLQSSMNQEAVD